jgi:hypothetical protein
METEFRIGDRVRVKDPSGYKAEFKAKYTNREGVIESVGDGVAHMGQWKGYAWIRWLKKGNRGKEFKSWLQFRNIEKVEG